MRIVCAETENRYADPSASSGSLLRDAKAMLEQGGSLTEVALMIEAAIQKGDLGEGGYEAWLLLGEVRSMDEREEQSMRALMEGVKRAEAAGAAGAGMMVSLQLSRTQNVDTLMHRYSRSLSHSPMNRTNVERIQCCFVGCTPHIPLTLYPKKPGSHYRSQRGIPTIKSHRRFSISPSSSSARGTSTQTSRLG